MKYTQKQITELVKKFNTENSIGSNYTIHCYADKFLIEITIIVGDGLATIRLMHQYDDSENFCIYCLSVNEDDRRMGAGTELIEYAERLGKHIGAKYSILQVIKDTWQKKWYERCGYVQEKYLEEVDNYVWMKKVL